MTVPEIWSWNANRYELARLISEGKTYKEAGLACGIAEVTVKGYMREVKEFKDYVDKITLESAELTRAGTTRILLRGIKEKLESMKDDKDTVLAYLKYLNEVTEKDEDTVTELEVVFK